MKRFAKELEKFETHFRIAIAHNVLSRNIIASDRKRLHEIDRELFGDSGNFKQTCRGCLMAILKRVGAEYLKYITGQPVEVVESPEPAVVPPPTIKKKRGRKPAVKVEKYDAFVADESINEILPDGKE